MKAPISSRAPVAVAVAPRTEAGAVALQDPPPGEGLQHLAVLARLDASESLGDPCFEPNRLLVAISKDAGGDQHLAEVIPSRCRRPLVERLVGGGHVAASQQRQDLLRLRLGQPPQSAPGPLRTAEAFEERVEHGGGAKQLPQAVLQVVRVIGELDLSTAPRLLEVLSDLAGHGTTDVTLDLAEMAFIDSTGLSVLVSGLKRLRETGGDLVLQSPRASAMKVLEISGLTSVFAIHSGVTSDTTSNGDHHVHPEDT